VQFPANVPCSLALFLILFFLHDRPECHIA
jgi:hypothetical protein